MALHLVTSPTVEPVTAEQCRAHSRIDLTDEDDWLSTSIKVARQWCENYTRRAFINSTWSLKWDGFPCASGFEFPKAPLSSVTSVVYVDTAQASQTWATSNYEVDAVPGEQAMPGRLVLADGITWPTTYDQINAVTVTFVAGYGATAGTVPEGIRQAILLMVGEMYERREDTVMGSTPAKVSFSVKALLSPYVLRSY